MKFVQTKGDPCLYVFTDEEPVIIAVYVNDILIAGRTDKRIAKVKTPLLIDWTLSIWVNCTIS